MNFEDVKKIVDNRHWMQYEMKRSHVFDCIYANFFHKRKQDKEPWKLSSGLKSYFYFDTRHLLLFPLYAKEVAEMFKSRIHLDGLHHINKSVGGLETGAILLTSAITYAMGYPGFYVRKQLKDHGNDKLVVTPLSLNNRDVIIVDDIVSTGESITQAIHGVKRYYPNAHIMQVYSLVDRSEEFDVDPTDSWFSDYGISYKPIFKSKEFIDYT